MSESRVRITRLVCWTSLAALACLQLVESFLQPTPTLIWIMRVLPLLVFLPGIIADNLRSYIWLCFVCLLYFMTLVLRLFADPHSIVAILGMISVVSLFITGMFYVRWRAQELKEELVHE
jgi:uncharacterized membrane protein